MSSEGKETDTEENIDDMSVTLETSQDEMSWLKELIEENINDMSVTPETSQDEMSWLK